MEPKKYLKLLAHELASEFAPIRRLRNFTRNSDIVGAHAEAAVRQFVRRAVAPLRVSTGAIIYENNTGEVATLRQLDTMIWSTAMAPAVFECGEFALVPRGNCHVALEIKRTSNVAGVQEACSPSGPRLASGVRIACSRPHRPRQDRSASPDRRYRP